MRLHIAYHHQNDQVVNFSARPTGCSGGERERDELDVERSGRHGNPQRAYVTGDIVDHVVGDEVAISLNEADDTAILNALMSQIQSF